MCLVRPLLPSEVSTATSFAIDTDDVGRDSSITIGADGLGLISYHDFAVGLKVAHCGNFNCTFADLITPLDPDGRGSTSVTVGADGFGLISYEGADDAIRVAHCSDAACSAATITPHDAGNAQGDTSITVGADGLGLISYFDNESVKIAHCSNVTCSAATFALVPRDVDTEVGTESAITIGADGLPLLAYHDETHEDLMTAHCSNVFCVQYFRRR